MDFLVFIRVVITHALLACALHSAKCVGIPREATKNRDAAVYLFPELRPKRLTNEPIFLCSTHFQMAASTRVFVLVLITSRH